MTKILRIGDPHVQVSNLKDAEALMKFALEVAKCEGVDVIEFLGDLFHTHAVIRLEVIDFWRKTFDRLETLPVEVRVLVGNHDQPGSKEKEQEMNALNVFGNTTKRTIVNEPTVIGNIGYIPYMSNEEVFFIAAAGLEKLGATELLVAHQTFTGAQYENGFFADDCIDPESVPQKQIISGHIHKTQQIGKCFYPGTPKWDTMADANQEKGIWIFEHNSGGGVESKIFISTEEVVTPIKSYKIKEGDELPTVNPDARNYVVLEGKSAWITKTKKVYGNTAQIKVIPTDRITQVKKENYETLETYLDKEFEPIDGVTKPQMKDFLGAL